MDHTILMSVIESLSDLFQNGQHTLGSTARFLLQYLSERATCHKGSDQIGIAKLLAKIIDRKDMWMVQPQKGRGFLSKTRHKTLTRLDRKCLRHRKSSEHNSTILRLLLGCIDGIHIPIAKQLLNIIVSQPLPYEFVYRWW